MKTSFEKFMNSTAVEDYIANLQRVTGVLDDQLRPAFQQLLTATGSITKSQDALQTALNISAATGKSLTEVSAALTRGFSGNTTGLSRLGAGISKATLKTGDMNKIMAELNKKKKLTKKQLAEQTGPGRKSTTEVVKVESDWQTYWGSSKELLNDVKELGNEHFECIILQLCKTKKELTYFEIHHQCKSDVLLPGTVTYNDNILGKFFKKDLA